MVLNEFDRNTFANPRGGRRAVASDAPSIPLPSLPSRVAQVGEKRDNEGQGLSSFGHWGLIKTSAPVTTTLMKGGARRGGRGGGIGGRERKGRTMTDGGVPMVYGRGGRMVRGRGSGKGFASSPSPMPPRPIRYGGGSRGGGNHHYVSSSRRKGGAGRGGNFAPAGSHGFIDFAG